jgi:hypothetical protein
MGAPNNLLKKSAGFSAWRSGMMSHAAYSVRTYRMQILRFTVGSVRMPCGRFGSWSAPARLRERSSWPSQVNVSHVRARPYLDGARSGVSGAAALANMDEAAFEADLACAHA